MIKIDVFGLKDGEYPINIEALARDVPDMYPEFYGRLNIIGKLRKIGKRYSFTGTTQCCAMLVCDRSLKEFSQQITADLNLSFRADNLLYKMTDRNRVNDNEEIIIHEEDKYIDISSRIREMLAVMLPMKRIAPEYAEKNFEDIFPEYSSRNKKKKKEEASDYWAPLKNIKLN